MLNEVDKFEKGFPDGIYVALSKPNGPRIRVHELYAYCKQTGKSPEYLNEEELKQILEYD